MHHGTLPSGEYQLLYFPEDHDTYPGWFKGMEVIIRECGLWPEKGLASQCPDFKCPADCMDCCCWCLLFNQPDFASQKPKLQEYIELHGHICNFYPKCHCKLNFFKQYWGVAKLHYCTVLRAATIKDMEAIIPVSLNCVSLLMIWQ